MRLGDLDYLARWLKAVVASLPIEDKARASFLECLAKVNAMEEVKAEPVRHGQWLPIEIARSLGTFKGIQCSICENKKIYSGTYPLPNYCENCGAKMDLKE